MDRVVRLSGEAFERLNRQSALKSAEKTARHAANCHHIAWRGIFFKPAIGCLEAVLMEICDFWMAFTFTMVYQSH